MRVLDLGAGRGGAARALWPGAEIVRVDVDPAVEPDVVGDVRALPEGLGTFDAILASHVLEHLARAEVLPALEHWVDFLAPGGMLHVLVPDLAWAAEQVTRAGQVPVAVMLHVYGSQQGEYQFHKMGFTVGLLRAAVAKAGLVVRAARVGPYEIVIPGDGGDDRRVVAARQIYVVGIKREEAE